MIATTCPHCGKPAFGRTDTAILERLQAAQEPMTAEQLITGLNMSRGGWHAARNRINAHLNGYRVVNTMPAATTARYRLQKIEEA